MMSTCTVLSKRKNDLRNSTRRNKLDFLPGSEGFQLKVLEKFQDACGQYKFFDPSKVKKDPKAQNTLVFSSNFPNICYEIKRHVQAAQQGAVFNASEYLVTENIELNYRREVAIKILFLREYTPPDIKRVELTEAEFKEEAQGHLNVLVYDDYWIHNKIVYVVTPFAEYEDLFEVMKKRDQGFPENELRWLFRQILDGANFLERRGIAFRDHSLENILIFYDEVINVIIPKINDPEQATRLVYEPDGSIRDVPVPFLFGKTFRPPEVYGTNATYNPHKADVFCLGWMLFYLGTRVQPFCTATEADKHWKIIASNKFSDLLDKLRVNHISAELKDLLWHMLDPNMKTRYSLKECLNHPWFTYENTPIGRDNLFGSSIVKFRKTPMSPPIKSSPNTPDLQQKTPKECREELQTKNVINDPQENLSKNHTIVTTKPHVFGKNSGIYVSSAVSPGVYKHSSAYLGKSLISLMNETKNRPSIYTAIQESNKTNSRSVTAPQTDDKVKTYTKVLSKNLINIDQASPLYGSMTQSPTNTSLITDTENLSSQKGMRRSLYYTKKDLVPTNMVVLPERANKINLTVKKIPVAAVAESTDISTTETLGNGVFSANAEHTISSKQGVIKEEIIENFYPLQCISGGKDKSNALSSTIIKPLVKRVNKTCGDMGNLVRFVPRVKQQNCDFVVNKSKVPNNVITGEDYKKKKSQLSALSTNEPDKCVLREQFSFNTHGSSGSVLELGKNTNKSSRKVLDNKSEANEVAGSCTSCPKQEESQNEISERELRKRRQDKLVAEWENRIAKNAFREYGTYQNFLEAKTAASNLKHRLNATERIAQIQNNRLDDFNDSIETPNSEKVKSKTFLPTYEQLVKTNRNIARNGEKEAEAKTSHSSEGLTSSSYRSSSFEKSIKPSRNALPAPDVKTRGRRLEEKEREANENLSFMSPTFYNRVQSELSCEISGRSDNTLFKLKKGYDRIRSYESETTEWEMSIFSHSNDNEDTLKYLKGGSSGFIPKEHRNTQSDYLSECEEEMEDPWPEEITGVKRAMTGRSSKNSWNSPSEKVFNTAPNYFDSCDAKYIKSRGRLSRDFTDDRLSSSSMNSGISDDSVIAW